MNLGKRGLGDILESLHLLFHRATHASVSEADRVGNVNWEIRLPGQQLRYPGSEFLSRFMREECCRQGLAGVKSLSTREQEELLRNCRIVLTLGRA